MACLRLRRPMAVPRPQPNTPQELQYFASQNFVGDQLEPTDYLSPQTSRSDSDARLRIPSLARIGSVAASNSLRLKTSVSLWSAISKRRYSSLVSCKSLDRCRRFFTFTPLSHPITETPRLS